MTGTLTLSLEIELAWGWHDMDSGGQYLSPARELESRMLKRLLSTCEELDIEISFDIVGHLFLDQCDGIHKGDYPPGWFSADPGGDVATAPQYYAPDLVEVICESSTEHEVCTHTFSHILCDEVPEEVVAQELEHVIEIHEDYGLEPPTSFVAPRHRCAPQSTLKRWGIRTVRIPAPEHQRPDNPVREYISGFTQSPPIKEPTKNDIGLVETYCTPYPSLTAPYLPNGQKSAHPTYQVIPSSIRRRLHERYLERSLDAVIQRGSHLHHWSHLYNMSNEDQWRPIRSFLEETATRRDQGDLEICTMDDLDNTHSR